MAEPQLVVRVAANLAELRQAMQEGAAGMSVLGDATAKTEAPVNTLRDSLTQFDQTLSASGINIGKHVRGLSEIADMSGKTTTSIGLLGTGMAVGAAAMAGWNVGRWIADWTGVDKAISGAADKLLKAAEAGAHLDTLAIASERAGYKIVDLSEAMKINKEWGAALATGYIDWNQRLAATMAELDKFSEAELREIDLGKKLGASHAQLKQDYDISRDALNLVTQRLSEYTAETQKADAITKKWATESEKLGDALDEIKSAGDGWKGTLAAINPVLVDQIKLYLEAGVSQGALEKAYGLTTTQIKSVATALKEEDEALKVTNKSILETVELWNAHNRMVVEQGGTAMDVAMAKIQQWADDEVAKLKESDQNWGAHYEMIQQNAAKMREGVLVNWSEIGKNSRSELQQTADVAKSTFDYMQARPEQFSETVRAQFEKTAVDAQRAADTWDTAFSGALDHVQAKVEAATLSFSEAMDLTRQGLGTLTATIEANLSNEGRKLTQRAWDEGRYYGPVVDGTTQNPHGTGPDFKALGYRALGGPVSSGSPYMVGERGPEVFVPERSGTIIPNGGGGTTVNLGGITINGSVLGTQEGLAAIIGDAVTSTMRKRGFREPVGV